MASKPRPIPNKALWALEFAYARQVEVEALLVQVLKSTSLSQHDRARIQATRLAASRTREQIVKAHPGAPGKAVKW